MAEKVYRYQSTCEICGKTFGQNRKVKHPTCSLSCYNRFYYQQRALNYRIEGYVDTCLVCGKTYQHRTFSKWPTCSLRCQRKESYQRRGCVAARRRRLLSSPHGYGPRIWPCKKCGTSFAARSSNQRTCGDCKQRTIHGLKQRHDRLRNARRRGGDGELIDPITIYKRDNYICQICFKKTRPDFKRTHPLYPSIDHIVPVTKDGKHLSKNVRCAHLKCNISKGNRATNDQLLLLG